MQLLQHFPEHVVSEIERALNDALRVVAITKEDGKILPGGGAVEAELALRIREYGNKVGGREQLAIEAFSKALEIIPRTLAENASMASCSLPPTLFPYSLILRASSDSTAPPPGSQEE